MRILVVAVLTVAGCGTEATTPPAPDLRMPKVPGPCTNGFTDADETDQDCGGSLCAPCDTGKGCKGAKDCASGICVNKACAAPSCADMVKNGDESDIDCGGSCSTKCAEGKPCNDGPDCASMTCVNGVCGKSPCTNMALDGMETDVDCGGPVCDKCADGKMCNDGTDCASTMCVNNVCKSNCPMGMGDCDGNAANGCEVDTSIDAKNCGGCGNACPIGMPSCAKGKCSSLYSPVGVQAQVPLASLAGWNECFKDLYNNNMASVANVLKACDKSKLMLACRKTGDSILALLAWAPRADVLFDVGNNEGSFHNANGTAWYFSQGSWGFAPLGDPVHRVQCDYYQGGGQELDPERRLCWHAGGLNGNLNPGFRCGNNSLNNSKDYERLIFEAD